MTTPAQLRRTALSLPGAAAREVRAGSVAFTVGGKRFAALAEGDEAELHLAPEDVRAFLAAYPGARARSRGGTPAGVRIGLADIDGQQLNRWVRRAWMARAPKRLAAQAEAADTAAPGAVGDLPKAIGRPATQALANAGITTLARIARMDDAELLAMHGVGPRAVRILRETISATPGS